VEPVHQLRVGSRRASAALELFCSCLPEKTFKMTGKRLKNLRRAAGEVRDWDVFLQTLHRQKGKEPGRSSPGLDYLIGYASGQRAAAKESLNEAATDHPFSIDHVLSETLAAIHRPHSRPRKLGDLAEPLLKSLADDLEVAGSADLNDYQNLHKVRIAGKRLRYAIEIVAGCFSKSLRETIYPAIEEVQEILGQANDSHVAQERLTKLRQRLQAALPSDWKRFKAGIEGLLRFHEQRLPKDRNRFLLWWRRWKKLVDGSELA
jgi:CHAD domain-containing protein